MIQNNQSASFGGGIFAYGGSNPTFIDSTIQNNVAGVTAANGVGGGIGLADASATLRTTVVTGNRSKFAGGGIFSRTDFSTPYTTVLTLEDSQVSGTYGGASHRITGSGRRRHRHRRSGHCAGRPLSNPCQRRRWGRRTEQLPGALRAHWFVRGSNQAAAADNGAGGGILASSSNDVPPIRPAAVTVLTDTVVRNNAAARVGGGISADGDVLCAGGPCGPSAASHAVLTATASLVDGNTAGLQGAGIYANRANVTVSGGHVLRNSLTGGGSLSFGGGIALFDSNTSVTGATIASNLALLGGGGIFLNGGTVSIDGANIYGNTASGISPSRGGGIFVALNPAPVGTVQRSIIADNTNFQIAEDVCPPAIGPVLSYLNNVITPRPGFNDAYHSVCNPPGDNTAAQLNALPSGRASGNTAAVPVFASFTATPDNGPSVLSWTVARASSVSISGLGSKPGPTSSQDVAPAACPQTFVLTASTFSGSSRRRCSARLGRPSSVPACSRTRHRSAVGSSSPRPTSMARLAPS